MNVYTPSITKKQSGTLRRIAWGFGIPMTTVMSYFIELSLSLIDKRQICTNCKDKSFCTECYFYNKPRSKFPGTKLIMKRKRFYLNRNK